MNRLCNMLHRWLDGLEDALLNNSMVAYTIVGMFTLAALLGVLFILLLLIGG